MKNYSNTFILNQKNIDKCSAAISDFSSQCRFSKKETLGISLSFEEVLLRCMDEFGTDTQFILKMSRRFGKMNISIILPGKSFDPVESKAEFFDEEGLSFGRLMDNLSLRLNYNYKNGMNSISCERYVRSGDGFLKGILLAVVLAVIFGLAGNMLDPAVKGTISTLLDMISGVILGLIRMAALPVIFLSTVKGITGCGDIASFGKLSKTTLLNYFLTMLFTLAVTVTLCLTVFPQNFSAGAGSTGDANTMFAAFLTIFPDNIFSPFLNGDNIKILFLAMLFGCGILAAGPKAEGVSHSISVLNDIAVTIMTWICRLLPLMFFVLIVRSIWDKDNLKSILSLWKLILILALSYIAAILFEIIIVSKKTGIRINSIVSAIFPASFKGFVTGSSMFAYTDMEDTLENKLNVPSEYVSFRLPLGITFFQVSLILLSGISLYFSSVSGMPVSVSWFVTLLILCYITSVASPPVSGGLVALLAMIFTSLGISDVYLGIASMLIMLLDYPSTGGRVALMMLEITRISARKKN